MPKILVANSDEGAQKKFVEALTSDGHTFSLCSNGESVRKAISGGAPDLVILDVDLPDLDVFEMVEILGDTTSGKGIPIIVVESDASEPLDQVQSGHSRFTWMGMSTGPEDLRNIIRAKLSGMNEGGQGKILVVDDDSNIRNALTHRLKREGYDTRMAHDGLEGLEALEDGPDLVLLDVAMPNLDGFGFLERMREESRFREIPVIVMTAHAHDADEVARGLSLGANDYVRKPFEWTELFARARTQLRIRELNRLVVEKQRDLAVIELAGAAAHEINNPLAVVMARLELILSHMKKGDEMFRPLNQIDQLVRRIAIVVEKMGQVRSYQVRNYCGGIDILDLEGASSQSAERGSNPNEQGE